MSEIWSYTKIFNLGHPKTDDILKEYVSIGEKYDGSQLSVARIDGKFHASSKRCKLDIDNPPDIFAKALNGLKDLDIPEGYVLRGEAFKAPKHNSLCYERVPNRNFGLFDVEKGPHRFMLPVELSDFAKTHDLETVPIFFEGIIEDVQKIKDMLQNVSSLGGTKIEGVVVKAYSKFMPDGAPLFAKYVSEAYKEKNRISWKEQNPSQGDIVARLISTFAKDEVRWNKTILRLTEENQLEHDPRDIGKLIKEVQSDFTEECKDVILDELWKWIYPKIIRSVTNGFPEFYKERLLNRLS